MDTVYVVSRMISEHSLHRKPLKYNNCLIYCHLNNFSKSFYWVFQLISKINYSTILKFFYFDILLTNSDYSLRVVNVDHADLIQHIKQK